MKSAIYKRPLELTVAGLILWSFLASFGFARPLSIASTNSKSPLANNKDISGYHDFDDIRIAIISAQTKLYSNDMSQQSAYHQSISTASAFNATLIHMSPEHAKLFVQNKREWANYHEYDYLHTIIQPEDHSQPQLHDISPEMLKQSMEWVKIDLLQKYLGSYDWICWMDIDSLIVDRNVKLEEIILNAMRKRPKVSLIIDGSEEYKTMRSSSIHTSMMLIKNTVWSSKLLARLKEILSDEEWMNTISKEVGGVSKSFLNDAIMYLLNSEPKSEQYVYLTTLQDLWNQQFLYLPKIGILHFSGCSAVHDACLNVFNQAVLHILSKDEMYIYQVAPYIQHLYNVFVAIYVIFAIDRLFHVLGRYLWPSRKPDLKKAKLPHKFESELKRHLFPFVVIQLPMFNEISCSKTVIDCCCLLDWPKSRFLIQVVDDSTSVEARSIIDERIWGWRERGVNIQLCRRNNRYGFKAGAMNDAMKHIPPETEFIAIFDADFQPQSSFLRSTVPYLMTNHEFAFVQCQWIYTNSKESLLTRMQEISLNYHFKCEQEVRFKTRKFFNFNGTAGVWRKSAIESVGGWHVDTLVEDMDLSLRVWANGWDFIYLDDVKVLNEIPPTFEAYRGQQHRWTSGPMQVLRKAMKTIIFSKHLSILDKLFCIWFFIRNYIHIVNFLYFLILIPLMIWIPRVTLYEWAVIWLPMAISMSNIIFTISEWPRVLLYILFENAMCMYKTGALICGILNIGKAKYWTVTPKFARKRMVPEMSPLKKRTREQMKHSAAACIIHEEPMNSFYDADSMYDIGTAVDISSHSSSSNATTTIELSDIESDRKTPEEMVTAFDPDHRIIKFSNAYQIPKPATKTRVYKMEVVMGIFLMICAYYAFFLRQYGIGVFSLLNGVAYFAISIFNNAFSSR